MTFSSEPVRLNVIQVEAPAMATVTSRREDAVSAVRRGNLPFLLPGVLSSETGRSRRRSETMISRESLIQSSPLFLIPV